jgi:type II secretion system protein C
MRSSLLAIVTLVAGTAIAAVAGAGISVGIGLMLSLGDGEKLRELGETAPIPKAPSSQATGSAVPSTAAVTTRTISRRDYIDTIVRRNMFDHQNAGKAAASAAAAIAGTVCEGDDCDADIGERSDLPLSLLGTMVVVPETYSSAMIRNESTKQVVGVGIGSVIEDTDARVASILARMVVVEREGGQREYILMDEEDKPAPRSPTAASTSGSDQIVQESENSYVIDRQLFDSALQDLDALSRMARAIPHRDSSGNPDGFRLSGVRRDQLLYNLGIRSGDIIHGVNGQPLTTMAEAMNAMQMLQRDSSFSFEVTRRGQRSSMNYQVR